MSAADILDLFELEVAPLDPPTPKTPRTKHEVDWMIRCGYMAVRIFRNERSVVGRWSVVNITLILYTRRALRYERR